MPVGTGISLQTAGQFIVVILLAVILVLASFTLRAASGRRDREHHTATESLEFESPLAALKAGS